MDICNALFWLGVGTGFVAGVAGTVGAIIVIAVWCAHNLKRGQANARP